MTSLALVFVWILAFLLWRKNVGLLRRLDEEIRAARVAAEESKRERRYIVDAVLLRLANLDDVTRDRVLRRLRDDDLAPAAELVALCDLEIE